MPPWWASTGQTRSPIVVDGRPVLTQEEYGVIGPMPEAIDHWARELAARLPGGNIAVCLEPSKGRLIDALLKYDHLVLYPVNPRMLAKFREAFAPSGKKDDPTDAPL